MAKQPLGEIFGFPINNNSPEAQKCRKNRLCPYNNKVPNCTKDRAKNPLGVCSIIEKDTTTIVCPIRLRQNWSILDPAVNFFFPQGTTWTSIADVKLYDKNNYYVGTIDFVLVAYNSQGDIVDFGALDTHAAYVTQNLRRPFEAYMNNPEKYMEEGFTAKNYPYADYLSTIRRRIAPQLIYKGSIFHNWGKKTAIAIDKGLYESLPPFTEVPEEIAEVSWQIYDLVYNEIRGENVLELCKTVFTLFEPTLFQITYVSPGPIELFISTLQEQLNEQLDTDYPPDAPALGDLITD
jgi:hypothetical protein